MARWRSSAQSSRAFCATCGSTLGVLDDAPSLALALGCFDQPDQQELAPLFHAHSSTLPIWWSLASAGDA